MKKILFVIIVIFLLVSFGFITINPIGLEWIDNIKQWFQTRDWKGLYEFIKNFLTTEIYLPIAN